MFEKIMNIIEFVADVGVMFTSSLGMGSLFFDMLHTVVSGGQPPVSNFLGLAGYITGLILWSFKTWSDLKDMMK